MARFLLRASRNFKRLGAAVSLVVLFFVVAAGLIRFFRRLFFRRRLPLQPQPRTLCLPLGPRLSAFAWIIVVVWIGVLMDIFQGDELPTFAAVERYFSLINWTSVAAAIFSIFAIIEAIGIWRREDARAITKIKFSLVGLACLFLTWFSIHWNLIGPIQRF